MFKFVIVDARPHHRSIHIVYESGLREEVGAGLTPRTEIGAVFSLRKIQDGFQSYTVYCGNHGLAMEELELVMRDKEVARVLEGCRLLVEKGRSQSGTFP